MSGASAASQDSMSCNMCLPEVVNGVSQLLDFVPQCKAPVLQLLFWSLPCSFQRCNLDIASLVLCYLQYQQLLTTPMAGCLQMAAAGWSPHCKQLPLEVWKQRGMGGLGCGWASSMPPQLISRACRPAFPPWCRHICASTRSVICQYGCCAYALQLWQCQQMHDQGPSFAFKS